MSAMDGSIVNVSLVTIANDLNTDMEGIRWIVIVYLLVISALIGIGGSFGDNYGRKTIFQLGMVLFVLGSIFCALSPILEFLVISRIIQAIGAAALTANGLALVITYVEPSIRGRAIGINSLVVASALSSGPVIGGILTQYIGWPSIFLINIPIGFIGVILVQRFIPETERKSDSQLDYLGMILFIVTIFALIQGILTLFQGNFFGLLFILIAVTCAVIFVRIETQHSTPMIAVGIMRDRKILVGIISSFLCYMVYYSVVFLLPFYYQEVLLFKQSQTGILMVVPPLAMAIMGPFAGVFAERVRAKKSTTLGATFLGVFVMFLALLLFIFPKNNLTILLLLIPLVAFAAGSLTTFTVSNGTSVMNAAPKGDVSVVSGLIGLSRNIGFALATTLSSAFFALFFAMNNPTGSTSGSIFVSSYYLTLGEVYVIFALLAVLGALISYQRGQ
jgi:EmrB/QacA subfamily drug resistance transporter